MGFGDFMTSSSQATDNRIAATDQAQVYRGNVGQNVAAGAVGTSGNSTLVGAGALNISKVGKGATVTVQSMDAEVAQSAMDRITGLAGAFGQSLNDFMTSANANALTLAALNADSLRTTQDSLLANQNQQEAGQQTNFQKILDKFSSLLANEQPAGDTLKNNIVLYVTLGVLALVGMIWYFRK